MRFEGGNRKARRWNWTVALLELMLLIVCGCLLRRNKIVIGWTGIEWGGKKDDDDDDDDVQGNQSW